MGIVKKPIFYTGEVGKIDFEDITVWLSPGILFQSHTNRKGAIIMTENEAIEVLQSAISESEKLLHAFQNENISGTKKQNWRILLNIRNCRSEIESCNVAINALKEIQQYRESEPWKSVGKRWISRSRRKLLGLQVAILINVQLVIEKLELGYKHCIICGQLLKYPYEN